MKPARSPHETATLPTCSHSASTVSRTSSAVVTVETTSTSFMIGAGLKKCMPMTSCGRFVAVAHEMIGEAAGGGRQDRARLADLVEVLEQRGLDREVLRDRLDTRSASARSSRLVVPVRWPSTSGFTELLELAALDRLVERALDGGADAVDLGVGARPTYVTSYPALAKTSTMPVAMVPVPTTPIRRDRPHAAAAGASRLGRLGVGHDDRAVGSFVGVEAATGLAAEEAGGDQLLEDRRRRVEPVAALLVHRVEDLVRRVEADQVEQRQRAHRVAAAEAHRGVDVLARWRTWPRTSRPRG